MQEEVIRRRMVYSRWTRFRILIIILYRMIRCGFRWMWTGKRGGAILFDAQGANVFDPALGERASQTWIFYTEFSEKPGNEPH